MAAANNRSTEQVQREIESERERLAVAVDSLRAGIDEVTSLRGKLPAATAAAFGIGFLAAGGIGATMRRLATRRAPENRTNARFGPFSRAGRS
jgi:hypothetical protein